MVALFMEGHVPKAFFEVRVGGLIWSVRIKNDKPKKLPVVFSRESQARPETMDFKDLTRA